MSYKKWIAIILIVALLGAGAARALSQRSRAGGDGKGTVTEVTVELGEIQTSIEASGRVIPLKQATLAFDTPGTVAEILAQEGQWVQAGQPLIRLDTAALERAVRSAEQNLAIQEANLAKLKREPADEDVSAARAAVLSAQAQLEQLVTGPRAEEIAAAEANFQASEAGLWAAAAQRDQVTAGPTSAEIASAQAQVASAQTQQKVAQDTHDATLQCHTVTLPNGEEKEVCPGLGTREEQARYNLHAANQALEAAQAQLDLLLSGANQEQIDAARANVAVAAAQRDAAQAQLDLLLAGSTEAQIAAARAQVAQAKATLAALQAGPSDEQIQIAEAQVEQARIALEEAQDKLAQASLKAPFDGVVTHLPIESGEWTLAGSPVVTLADLSHVEIELAVDEVDIGQVKVGQPAQVSLEPWPNEQLPATVSRIAPSSLSAAGGGTGLVTYHVYLELDLDAGAQDLVTHASGATDARVIRPEMTANAEVITHQLPQVLLVPNRAIQVDRAAGRYTVERVPPTSVDPAGSETVEITIGLRNATHTQVLSGLEAGDVVLVRSIKNLEPDLMDARTLFTGR